MVTDTAHEVLEPERLGKVASHETAADELHVDQAESDLPIIGVPLLVQQGHQGPQLLADAVGAWAVERMRGRIELIPLWPFPTHKHVYQSLWPLLQSLDGLFLPASVEGMDWYHHWQAGEYQPGPAYWSLCWELALTQLATYLGMPILAIADGAEQWNSALGGQRGARPGSMQADPLPPDAWEQVTIRVRTQSTLASSLQPVIAAQEDQPPSWELALMPHQQVEQLAPGLRSCAQSERGKLVAFERRDGAFGLGILARLDWGLDQAYSATLFEAFLQACRAFDLLRQQNAGWEASREQICATVSECVRQGQPLFPVSQRTAKEQQRMRPLSASLSSSSGFTRQRSHALTKEELNQLRRQRLKGGAR